MSKIETAPPTPAEARAAFAPALAPALTPARQALARLAAEPPQTLILEGGSTEQRTAMGLWYAALLNCAHGAPCLDCPVCLQIGAQVFQDLAVLDGRGGHIPIEQVRALRASLGEAPRGNGRRVILLLEAQALGTEAANALLKSLEEPRPGLAFLMLAPQRERLLPTLVSRGWVLTLPWPAQDAEDPALREWTDALAAFLASGRGWFDRAGKGALDAALARRILVAVRKALAAAMRAPRGTRPSPGLSAALSVLPDAGRVYAADVLNQCQNSLDAQVNPALTLGWMAARLYVAVRAAGRRGGGRA